MTWHRAFADRPRRLAKGDEELPDHPDYLPTSLIAPRVGHMLRAIAQHPDVSSSAQDLAHSILKSGDHHSLPYLADALEESDNGDPSHPTNWINWRNAGHGIELDKRVLGAIVDFQQRQDEQMGRDSGLGRFDTHEQRAAHAARFGAPGVHPMEVMAALSPVGWNGLKLEDRQRLYPAVRQSMDRLGQHGADEAYQNIMPTKVRDMALAGQIHDSKWARETKEQQQEELGKSVRYEEPADIKFPGE